MKVMIDALSQIGAGSRTYLQNVLPRLATRDDEIRYIILWPTNREIPENITKSDKLVIKLIPVPQKPALIRFLFQQLVIPFLARKVDVFFAPVDISPLLATCPVLLAIRNPNPFNQLERPILNKLYFDLKRILIKISAYRAAHILYVSRHSQHHINSLLGVNPEKTSVIYHGVDPEKFSKSEKDVSSQEKPDPVKDLEGYILCVSTVTPHKNFETLMEGYALLPGNIREQYPLVVVGRIASRKYHQSLIRIAEKDQLVDCVRFVGEQPYTDIEKFYKRASLFVLPSRLETFGHTLVEAMAAGVPVIASDASAVPEILGDGGVLFDPDHPQELTQSMESVLTDEDLADELISRGIDRIKDFSWDRNVDKLVKVFRSSAQ